MNKNKIKILRERTMCPIKQCLKALNEADGEIEEAINILKKAGIKDLGPSDDSSNIFCKDAEEKIICTIGLNDVDIAYNDKFQKEIEEIINTIVKSNIQDVQNQILQSKCQYLSGIFKDNIIFKKILFLNDNTGIYLHDLFDQKGLLARKKSIITIHKEQSIVNIKEYSKKNNLSFKLTLNKIAAHILALKPKYICMKNMFESNDREQFVILLQNNMSDIFKNKIKIEDFSYLEFQEKVMTFDFNKKSNMEEFLKIIKDTGLIKLLNEEDKSIKFKIYNKFILLIQQNTILDSVFIYDETLKIKDILGNVKDCISYVV